MCHLGIRKEEYFCISEQNGEKEREKKKLSGVGSLSDFAIMISTSPPIIGSLKLVSLNVSNYY